MILSMFAPAEHQGGLLPHGLSPTVYCTMQAICPVHSVEEKYARATLTASDALCSCERHGSRWQFMC